jgi:hypothetical protein
MPWLLKSIHPTGPGYFGVAGRGIAALVSPERLRKILARNLFEVSKEIATQPGAHLSAGRARQAPCVRRHREVPDRSALAGSPVVLRILSWRQRGGFEGKPSDGLDRLDREAYPAVWLSGSKEDARSRTGRGVYPTGVGLVSEACRFATFPEGKARTLRVQCANQT